MPSSYEQAYPNYSIWMSFRGEVKRKFGRIDVLFANAGIAPVMPFDHITEGYFDAMLNIQCQGRVFTVQKALPLLSKGASVILTTTAAVEKGMPGISVYAASKAAVRSLARSMSAELIGRGIRVNVLSPGPVETPIVGKMGLTPEQAKGMFEHITNNLPMKRVAHADELAKAALFLSFRRIEFHAGFGSRGRWWHGTTLNKRVVFQCYKDAEPSPRLRADSALVDEG